MAKFEGAVEGLPRRTPGTGRLTAEELPSALASLRPDLVPPARNAGGSSRPDHARGRERHPRRRRGHRDRRGPCRWALGPESPACRRFRRPRDDFPAVGALGRRRRSGVHDADSRPARACSGGQRRASAPRLAIGVWDLVRCGRECGVHEPGGSRKPLCTHTDRDLLADHRGRPPMPRVHEPTGTLPQSVPVAQPRPPIPVIGRNPGALHPPLTRGAVRNAGNHAPTAPESPSGCIRRGD